MTDNSVMADFNIETCLVFAARYAHKRNTGASLAVVSTILNYWDELSPFVKTQLAKEAQNEATTNLEDWEKIIKRYIDENTTV